MNIRLAAVCALPAFIVLAFSCLNSPVQAQSGTSELTLTLDQSTVTIMQGQSFLFTGVLSNVPTDTGNIGGTLTLAPAILNTSSSDATQDDSLYNGTPGGPGYDFSFGTSPDTLAPGANSGDIPLFNIDVLASAAPNEVITGSFEADYEDSSGAFISGAPKPFYITVAPAPTPEPSTLAAMLIATSGLGLLVGCRRLRPHRSLS